MPRDCTARPFGYCPMVPDDVQSRCCGGIQYTQLSNMNKIKQKSKAQSHVYRGVRDIMLNDARAAAVTPLMTSASGVVSTIGAIVPMALTVPQSISGGVSGSYDTVLYGRNAWLSNTARNFQSYRITRATLIFVGSVGSNATGTLNMFASRDYADAAAGIQTAYVVGRDSKSFDLASSAGKELKLPMPVDTSWKKITGELAVLGNVGFAGSAYSVVQLNTINDLVATSFAVQVVGGPASTNVGALYLDYDVEFRDPINITMNL
jgi:hypothetical protein